jgi:hypothetical protein
MVIFSITKGDKDRYVADLFRPGPLQDNAVQLDVGELAFLLAGAPQLDLLLDLLVQLGHQTRRGSGPPQRLGDILNAADRDPRQVHFDQGFFYRASTPLIAFDDRVVLPISQATAARS